MAQVILDQAEIVALVREIKATGMAQHVRMHRRQLGALRGGGDQIVHRLAGERLAPFRHEQPGQGIAAQGEITFDGPQLIAGDRMFHGQAVLEAPYP